MKNKFLVALSVIILLLSFTLVKVQAEETLADKCFKFCKDFETWDLFSACMKGCAHGISLPKN